MSSVCMKKSGRSLILRNRKKARRNLDDNNLLVDWVQEKAIESVGFSAKNQIENSDLIFPSVVESVKAPCLDNSEQECVLESDLGPHFCTAGKIAAAKERDNECLIRRQGYDVQFGGSATDFYQCEDNAVSRGQPGSPCEDIAGSHGQPGSPASDNRSESTKAPLSPSQVTVSGNANQKFSSLFCDLSKVTGSMESDLGKPRQTFSSLFSAPLKENGPIAFDKSRIQDVGSIGVKDGKPILSFSAADTALLAGRMGLALVVKFSHTIPASHLISSALGNIKIEGRLDWKFLNANHILITLSHSCDYVKFLCGVNELPIWFIGGCPMRVFKWTPNFHPSRETPIVAVWFRLPGLPAHLFAEDSLFKIGSLIGKPLQIDRITFEKEKLLFARICVETDLTCPRHDSLFLDIDGVVCEQPVVYERLPLFCSACMHVGHVIHSCYAKGRNPRPPKRVLSTDSQPRIQTVVGVSPMAYPKSCPTTVVSGNGNEKGVQIKGKEIDKEGFEMVKRKARGQRDFRSATWLMQMGVKRMGVMDFNKSFAAANGDGKGHGMEDWHGVHHPMMTRGGNCFDVLQDGGEKNLVAAGGGA